MFGLLLGTLLGTSPAIAEEVPSVEMVAQAEQAPVHVELLVIYATKEHNKQDPKIQHLLKYFKNYAFTGYELRDTHKTKLVEAQEHIFTLPQKAKVTVKIQSYDDQNAKVHVKIRGEDGHNFLDAKMVVKRNGHFIVAGPKFEKGILILPMSLQY